MALSSCKEQFDAWSLMMPSEKFPYWSRKGLDGLHRVLPMRCGHARVRKGEEVECLAGWGGSRMDFVAIATTDIEKRFRDTLEFRPMAENSSQRAKPNGVICINRELEPSSPETAM